MYLLLYYAVGTLGLEFGGKKPGTSTPLAFQEVRGRVLTNREVKVKQNGTNGPVLPGQDALASAAE